MPNARPRTARQGRPRPRSTRSSRTLEDAGQQTTGSQEKTAQGGRPDRGGATPSTWSPSSSWRRVYDKLTRHAAVTDADSRSTTTRTSDGLQDRRTRDVAAHPGRPEGRRHAGRRGAWPKYKKAAEQTSSRSSNDGGDFAKPYQGLGRPGKTPATGRLRRHGRRVRPDFDQGRVRLKTGESRKPVKSKFGFHIIKAMADLKKDGHQVARRRRQGADQDASSSRRGQEQGRAANGSTSCSAVSRRRSYATATAPPSTAGRPTTGTASPPRRAPVATDGLVPLSSRSAPAIPPWCRSRPCAAARDAGAAARRAGRRAALARRLARARRRAARRRRRRGCARRRRAAALARAEHGARPCPEARPLERAGRRRRRWPSSGELTARLRRDCPWDREQTAASIVPHTVEEAYEVADAAPAAALRAEASRRARRPAVPDVLPGAAARERGAGDLADVADGITREAACAATRTSSATRWSPTAGEVRDRWEQIKREQEGREGIFHDVPAALPGLLLRAQGAAPRRRGRVRLDAVRRGRLAGDLRTSSTSCARRSARHAAAPSIEPAPEVRARGWATCCSRPSTCARWPASTPSSRCAPRPRRFRGASRRAETLAERRRERLRDCSGWTRRTATTRRAKRRPAERRHVAHHGDPPAYERDRVRPRRQILDSRGNPTVEVDVVLERVRAAARRCRRARPPARTRRSSCATAARRTAARASRRPSRNVNGEIADALAGSTRSTSARSTTLLIELDGTPNKARLGANAILGTSLAVAQRGRRRARHRAVPLRRRRRRAHAAGADDERHQRRRARRQLDRPAGVHGRAGRRATLRRGAARWAPRSSTR